MTLTAITREISPDINYCELSFQTRQPIDVAKAAAQHKAYEACLAELGAKVVSLPAETGLPDAVFVEDPAVVLDEIAIVTNMGAPSRRPEAKSIAKALAPYRPVKLIGKPGTLEGGDVMRIGKTLFVGLSERTDRNGVEQLARLLKRYDYRVEPIEIRGCLHLKSACSYIGRATILVNRSRLDARSLAGFELLDVPDDEPMAANALLLSNTVVMPSSFPKTRPCSKNADSRCARLTCRNCRKPKPG